MPQEVAAIRHNDRQYQVPCAMNEYVLATIPSWPLANRRPLDRRNKRGTQVAALDECRTFLVQEMGNFLGARWRRLHWKLAPMEVAKVSKQLLNP